MEIQSFWGRLGKNLKKIFRISSGHSYDWSSLFKLGIHGRVQQSNLFKGDDCGHRRKVLEKQMISPRKHDFGILLGMFVTSDVRFFLHYLCVFIFVFAVWNEKITAHTRTNLVSKMLFSIDGATYGIRYRNMWHSESQ